jgi:hypothetical protein
MAAEYRRLIYHGFLNVDLQVVTGENQELPAWDYTYAKTFVIKWAIIFLQNPKRGKRQE